MDADELHVTIKPNDQVCSFITVRLKAEDVLDFLSEKLKEQKDNSNTLSGFKSRKFK